MSLRDFLIRRLSTEEGIPEAVILQVINFQSESLIRRLSSSQTVELTGFGRFKFRAKRALQLMDKMRSQEALFSRRLEESPSSSKYQTSLKKIREQIAYLKPKTDEAEKHL